MTGIQNLFFERKVEINQLDTKNIFPYRWILTAAHCLKDKQMFMVGLGIDDNGRFSREYVILTTNQYMHPMYSSGRMQPYDIG